MGRKKKKSKFKPDVISRPHEKAFHYKTDYLYDNEKEYFSIENLKANYYYEDAFVYQCNFCKKNFKDISLIEDHVKMSHPDKKFSFSSYSPIWIKIKRLKYQKYD